MKKFIAAAFLLAATVSFAQDKMAQKGERLSIEQRTELQVKKLTLSLDLNEKQQKETKALMLEQNKKLDAMRKERAERKGEAEKITAEDRFKMKEELLNDQIAFKAKMKNILTADQYSKWEAHRENRKDILKTHAKKHREGRGEMNKK